MYLVFTTNSFPWLTIFVVLPISAGSLIFFFPHRDFMRIIQELS